MCNISYINEGQTTQIKYAILRYIKAFLTLRMSCKNMIKVLQIKSVLFCKIVIEYHVAFVYINNL